MVAQGGQEYIRAPIAYLKFISCYSQYIDTKGGYLGDQVF